MEFEVTILGNNSALPAHNRNPTSQVISIQGKQFLIDCGEGTQMRLKKYGFKASKIDHIFISHLHGDHYFGFPGLVTSMSLMGRSKPLHVYSHKGLKEIFDLVMDAAKGQLNFELVWHILSDSNELIFENDIVEVYTIPLTHKIVTTGFLFKEKKFKRKIIPTKIHEHEIPFNLLKDIKEGNDYVKEDGTIISCDSLTEPPYESRSYAYCSDTAYNEAIVPMIKDVDLLYHESTFEQSAKERADYTKHSTASEAATIAKKANAKQLLLGHYSAKYKNLETLLAEAKAVFDNSELSVEGESYGIERVKVIG